MSIVIPKRLEKLLKKEQIWHTNIMQLCANTTGLYQDSPEFFPDYTIHGFGHINTVLEYVDVLIDQKTLRQLQPRDVAFLAAAVILHDAGMFLRRDGVQKLVTGSRRDDRIEHSGDEGWGKVWEDFVDRTKRYPEEKMRYLFGQHLTVTESCISKADLTDNDRRIIGEFLRQNHGRIAHEIAVNGLPGTVDIDVFDLTSFSRDDRYLIGLMARSHTTALRDTEPSLRSVFGKGSMPYSTPAFYLMAVLRMADALDAGKHRVSKFRDTQQKIRVPISVEEWAWNERINRSICRWDLAEKSRYIYASPTSSIEYVHLDKWLRTTQAELDLCWSILAEKYADQSYRLSIHRIQCNIHEPDVQETMNDSFLTREVKVSANPEIVKLMMSPLYGDNPSYGVRELLQNAVDACIERKEKSRRENRPYQGKVTISLGPQSFRICDNGVGMDENVLLNYYLCAGSSFRSSDEWKREYTEDGKSKVARTGRFGVGFLASFLLGDTIEVCSQHLYDEKGYAFSFNQDSRPLNIRRVSRPEGPGTTITIWLRAGVYETLKKNESPSWLDWYVFDDPIVEYQIEGETYVDTGCKLHRDPEQNTGWFTLDSDQYASYQWSTDLGRGGLYCNGIRIENAAYPDLAKDGLDVTMPALSIIDKNGTLNVDLARSKMMSFPEQDGFVEQFFRYHIARVLMAPWNTREDIRYNLESGFPLDYNKNVPFLLSVNGYQLNYASFLWAMGVDQLMLLYSTEEDYVQGICDARGALSSGIPFTIAPALVQDRVNSRFWSEYGVYTGSAQLFTEGILSDSIPILGEKRLRYDASSTWKYAWVRKDAFQKVHEYHRRKMTMQDWQYGGHDYVIATNTSVNDGTNQDFGDLFSLRDIEKQISSGDYYPADCFPVAFMVRPGKGSIKETGFGRALRSVLVAEPEYPQDLWIPFDPEERKKKFRTAFRELEPYLRMAESDRSLSGKNPDELVYSEKETKQMQKHALDGIQRDVLRREAAEKQRAEGDALLKTYRPDLLEVQEKINQGTMLDRLQAVLRHASKGLIARYVGIPTEVVPVQLAERFVDLLIRSILSMMDDEELEEMKNMDAMGIPDFSLADVMEMSDITDLSVEEIMAGIDEIPYSLRNEFIETLEDLRQLRDGI